MRHTLQTQQTHPRSVLESGISTLWLVSLQSNWKADNQHAHSAKFGQWDTLLGSNKQAYYASYTRLGGRWVGALFARRTLPAHTKVAEYSGPLMSERELRAVPWGNELFDASQKASTSPPKHRGHSLRWQASPAALSSPVYPV